VANIRVSRGLARRLAVGLVSWFKPARTETTSQIFSSTGALNKDRCRAGRWDREQLIGGKPVEARK
jgi:hypothetical protein